MTYLTFYALPSLSFKERYPIIIKILIEFAEYIVSVIAIELAMSTINPLESIKKNSK